MSGELSTLVFGTWLSHSRQGLYRSSIESAMLPERGFVLSATPNFRSHRMQVGACGAISQRSQCSSVAG
jgi:hypothetical protein